MEVIFEVIYLFSRQMYLSLIPQEACVTVGLLHATGDSRY